MPGAQSQATSEVPLAQETSQLPILRVAVERPRGREDRLCRMQRGNKARERSREIPHLLPQKACLSTSVWAKFRRLMIAKTVCVVYLQLSLIKFKRYILIIKSPKPSIGLFWLYDILT